MKIYFYSFEINPVRVDKIGGTITPAGLSKKVLIHRMYQTQKTKLNPNVPSIKSINLRH